MYENIAIKTVYKSSTIVRDLPRAVAFLSQPPHQTHPQQSGRIQTHLKAILAPHAWGGFSSHDTRDFSHPTRT